MRLRVVDKATGKPVAVKLHVHGEAGEYLAPVDRHRIPNTFWSEDWSVDYVNPGSHFCTYIPGETFVTYGPLMEFSVEGRRAGARIRMPRSGGSVEIEWKVASVTVPMTRADLVVNGEIRQSRSLNPGEDAGHWTLQVDRSSWIAFLLRGHYPDRPEIIAAHSSPVMVEVEGTPFFAAADAVTILEQIEGALAYIDTLATRPETEAYKRMRLVLTGAHRSIHNRLHQQGVMHDHSPPELHDGHRRAAAAGKRRR